MSSDGTAHPRELLSASIDGALSDSERRFLETHLAGCESCREVLADLRQLTADTRSLELPLVSPGLAGEVRARLLGAGVGRRRRRLAVPLAAVASLGAVGLLVALRFAGGPGRSERPTEIKKPQAPDVSVQFSPAPPASPSPLPSPEPERRRAAPSRSKVARILHESPETVTASPAPEPGRGAIESSAAFADADSTGNREDASAGAALQKSKDLPTPPSAAREANRAEPLARPVATRPPAAAPDCAFVVDAAEESVWFASDRAAAVARLRATVLERGGTLVPQSANAERFVVELPGAAWDGLMDDLRALGASTPRRPERISGCVRIVVTIEPPRP